MKILALCCLALVAAATAADVSEDVSKKSTTTPANITSPSTTSTEAPMSTSEAPKSTSEAPKSTSEAPKSTTEAPKTTTPASTTTVVPKTTTPAPTTSTAAPTTSTAAPTTSTAATTTSTVAPTTPPPSSQPWDVTVGNETCIVMEMMLSVEVSYPVADGKNKSQVTITVPVSAKANGDCGKEEQKISLTWGESNEIDMVFKKNESNYMLSNVSFMVHVNEETFPNISSSLLNQTLVLESSSMEFKTPVNQSYRCMREESLSLRSSKFNTTNAVLRLSKVQLQAFHKEAGKSFGNAQDCELDTPDIVPIAVGCALAGLVALVLVAYLVGRRRSQVLGYVSM